MGEWSISIYDRTGVGLVDIRSHALVSWTLNDVGKLEFIVPRSDPACKERYLRFGNLVRFRHSTAGDWGGFIYTPRYWRQDAIVVRALSAEFLFARRRGPANITYRGTAGAIFGKLLQIANEAEDTRIRPGSIWAGGKPHERTSRDTPLLDMIHGLQENSGQDWWLTPADDVDGRLIFLANWAERAGTRMPFELIEGINVRSANDDTLLIEQGDIGNDIAYSGIGATLESRPRVVLVDNASRQKYGLFQRAETSEAQTTSGLQSSAETFLSENREPRATYRIFVTDTVMQPTGISTFSAIGLGNTPILNMASNGFFEDGTLGTSTQVRILAKELSTEKNTMLITVDKEVSDG